MIPGSGRSPGEVNGNSPQYPHLGNPMDRRTWQATVHGVKKESNTTLATQFNSVQSLSHIQHFATPWTAASQASPSITNSQSLAKLKSTESVMPSNHLILCHPLLLLPLIFLSQHQGFQMSQFFASGGQNIGVSASTSVLPMNTQD